MRTTQNSDQLALIAAAALLYVFIIALCIYYRTWLRAEYRKKYYCPKCDIWDTFEKTEINVERYGSFWQVFLGLNENRRTRTIIRCNGCSDILYDSLAKEAPLRKPAM